MHSDFIKEIDLMKRVGQKHNSHVVSMICCTMNQEPKALVLEYVEYGDLLQYLQKNKAFVSVRIKFTCICIRILHIKHIARYILYMSICSYYTVVYKNHKAGGLRSYFLCMQILKQKMKEESVDSNKVSLNQVRIQTSVNCCTYLANTNTFEHTEAST